MASDRPPSKGDKPADKDSSKQKGEANTAAPRSGGASRKSESKKERDEAMGVALRSVYQNAASEPVPDAMLDLLKQLG